MASCELKRNTATGYCVFYIDGEGDLASLPTDEKAGTGDVALSPPCAIGSIARDVTGAVYTLNGSGAWVATSAGGGSGGISEADIATEEEVTGMLDDVFTITP